MESWKEYYYIASWVSKCMVVWVNVILIREIQANDIYSVYIAILVNCLERNSGMLCFVITTVWESIISGIFIV